MNRRDFLQRAAFASAAALGGSALAKTAGPPARRLRVTASELEERTIGQLQAAMQSGQVSAATLTRKYLARISDINVRGPALHAVIEVNPDAMAMAQALDRERKT